MIRQNCNACQQCDYACDKTEATLDYNTKIQCTASMHTLGQNSIDQRVSVIESFDTIKGTSQDKTDKQLHVNKTEQRMMHTNVGIKLLYLHKYMCCNKHIIMQLLKEKMLGRLVVILFQMKAMLIKDSAKVAAMKHLVPEYAFF